MMINMLSISPDDAPVVGGMKKFPNVYLNVGHGQRAGSLSMFSGQMIASAVKNFEKTDDYAPCDVLKDKISPKRYFN